VGDLAPAVITLMAGLGLANGLIATSTGVLVARVSLPAQRGEALSMYYVASSLGFALGPPAGFALYRAGGMQFDLTAAAALAALIGLLAWSITGAATRPVPGPRPPFRFFSRRALPAAGALILNNIGHSSIYAFLPLYALAQGLGDNIGWFYALFSAWIIFCRILLRRASDRVGRARVIVPAMALIAASFFVLAIPPTVPLAGRGRAVAWRRGLGPLPDAPGPAGGPHARSGARARHRDAVRVVRRRHRRRLAGHRLHRRADIVRNGLRGRGSGGDPRSRDVRHDGAEPRTASRCAAAAGGV
jgi:predicted MFS family arabinose efflux permease